MSESFGRQALHLYTLAARILGWRPDDFWTATPAELFTVLAPQTREGAPLGRAELNKLMELDNG